MPLVNWKGHNLFYHKTEKCENTHHELILYNSKVQTLPCPHCDSIKILTIRPETERA